MFVIGLTGGIASGKTTVARLLRDNVDAILDADKVSKEIMMPGSVVYEELVSRFGRGILEDNKTINRKALARRVFSKQENIQFLNKLTHPKIIEAIDNRLENIKRHHDDHTVLLLAPLLIEVGLVDDVDYVAVVVSDERHRIERIARSKGYNKEEARQIMAAQMVDEEKTKHADIVIDNNGSLEQLEEEVKRLLVEIERTKAMHC